MNITQRVLFASFNDIARSSFHTRQMDTQPLPTFSADFHEHSVIIFNADRCFAPKDVKALSVITAGIQDKEIEGKIKEAALLLLRRFWISCTIDSKRVIQTNASHSFSLNLEYMTWQHSIPLFCISLSICPMGNSCEFGLLTEWVVRSEVLLYFTCMCIKTCQVWFTLWLYFPQIYMNT